MEKRTKIGILGVTIVFVAVLLSSLRPRRDEGPETVLTSQICFKKDLVLNVATGKLMPRGEAYSKRAPFVSWKWAQPSARRRWRWFPFYKRISYTVHLDVANMDLAFAPTDKRGKVAHDYWNAHDSASWPQLPQRATSSYMCRGSVRHPMLFKTYDGTLGLMEITGIGPDGEIHLRHKVINAGQASGPEIAGTDESERFAVTLADGTRLEVVGIRCCSSGARDWWRPDGRRLERAPYINTPGVFRRGVNATPYEIAYRVTRGSETRGRVRMKILENLESFPILPQDEFRNNLWDIEGVAVGFKEGTESTTIAFGVAGEAWQTMLAAGTEGSAREYDSKYVGISNPRQEQGKVMVDFTVSWDWRRDYRTRFVAVDLDGEVRNLKKYRYTTGTQPGSLNRTRYTFGTTDLSLSQIKEFRFEVSPYQWVEFKNISLVPGEDCGFEIEVQETESESSVSVKGDSE
jgi:hypothetical protein